MQLRDALAASQERSLCLYVDTNPEGEPSLHQQKSGKAYHTLCVRRYVNAISGPIMAGAVAPGGETAEAGL